jgi:hypothetical protein
MTKMVSQSMRQVWLDINNQECHPETMTIQDALDGLGIANVGKQRHWALLHSLCFVYSHCKRYSEAQQIEMIKDTLREAKGWKTLKFWQDLPEKWIRRAILKCYKYVQNGGGLSVYKVETASSQTGNRRLVSNPYSD